MAQFNLGVFAQNAGRSNEAIAAFQKAKAADPSLAEAYYRLGTLMVAQNEVPEAVEYLKKYVSMSPSNAQNAANARDLLTKLTPHHERR
jgi:tetratricopeptide (TPR) repeat protein